MLSLQETKCLNVLLFFIYSLFSCLVQMKLNSKYMYNRVDNKVMVNDNSKKDFVTTFSNISIIVLYPPNYIHSISTNHIFKLIMLKHV